MDFPGNPGIERFFREIYSPKMIRDPGRETLMYTTYMHAIDGFTISNITERQALLFRT